jgi:hypothetical protein
VNAFDEVLTAAVEALSQTGYTSPEQVAEWQRRLREASRDLLLSDAELDAMLREALTANYAREVTDGGILRRHPGLDRFTYERIKPHLREELDRRIAAGFDLIKLNRVEAVNKMQSRFAGWSTSLPKGGPPPGQKRKQKVLIRKSLAQLPYEQRRLVIDQGHKLVSAINSIVAHDGGAIAGIWHSHWRERNYNYRLNHRARDLRIFAIRGCWALEQGLMKAGPAGYSDQITQPGEEVFCRCFYQYLYNLAQLPADMVTAKGRKAIEEARARWGEARVVA